jgi:hypothetical protein
MKFRGPMPFMPVYTVFYAVLRPMVHMPGSFVILLCPFVAGNVYLLAHALVVLFKVARQLKGIPLPEGTTEIMPHKNGPHGSSPVLG